MKYNQASGADGVKTAVLRKGCTILKFIWAAAHQQASALRKIMILIAGGRQDIKTNESTNICKYFDYKELPYNYLKQASDTSYDEIETQIEKCSTFFILIGSELVSSTWLNHCLMYAYQLGQFRMTKRPKLIGYILPGWQLPNCAKSIESDIEILQKIEDLNISEC